MGGTGDPPVPVGDPPTGMARRSGFLQRAVARKTRLSVPSGGSPDGTGQWPVPPIAKSCRNLLAAVAAVWLLVPATVPAQTNAPVTLAQISAAMAPVRSVASRFVQERHLSLFNEPLRSEGYLCFQKPGCIRWETTAPYQSILVSDGTAVAQFERADDHWKKLELGLGSALQSVMAQIAGVMDGGYASGRGGYSATVTNDADGPVVVLVPQNETVRKMMAAIEVHIAPDLKATRRVVLRETDGDYTDLIFSGQTVNPTLPPKTFDLGAPVDLKIIQAVADKP